MDARGKDESVGGSQARRGTATPTLVLACQVMKSFIEPRIAAAELNVVYLDFGLHLKPKTMASRLQAELDSLASPHLVLLGYGLCGSGLAGLRAGPHTLIIPRTDDCIAILLGSYDAYLRAFREQPGTYYLTRGWLESEGHPLGEYRRCLERFNRADADKVVDMLYGQYRKLCLIASSPEELEECAPAARRVAEFCAQRWGMEYQERIGSDDLIRRLLEAPRSPGALGEDFVVVPSGGEVEARMFLRG
jgi:hypothetical protein